VLPQLEGLDLAPAQPLQLPLQLLAVDLVEGLELLLLLLLLVLEVDSGLELLLLLLPLQVLGLDSVLARLPLLLVPQRLPLVPRLVRERSSTWVYLELCGSFNVLVCDNMCDVCRCVGLLM